METTTSSGGLPRLWLLATLCLIVITVTLAVAWYLIKPAGVSSPLTPEPETKKPLEKIEVQAARELPTVLSQAERMDLHRKLSAAQTDAEAAYVLSMQLDPAQPDWGAWRQEVSTTQLKIQTNEEARMKTALQPYNLSLAEAEAIWAFTLHEGRWMIPASDPIDSIADWYYRSGLRFYFAGGVENFTQAYYEFSVATAFGHDLAQKLAEKIAPLVPEEQRDHAVAFAINLQSLMIPPEEAGEMIE